MEKTFYVQGMDCIACESVLHDALTSVPAIKVVSLTHKTGKMTVEYKSKRSLNKLERILNEHDYSLIEESEMVEQMSQKTKQQWIKQGAIFLTVALLFGLFMQIDLTDKVQDYGANMGLGVAFLVGLVACGSSCLAVTGGIVVSYVEALEDKNWLNLVKVQGLFHLGRMITFILGGAVLGSIGKTFQISPLANAIFMIVVGLILVYVGLQIFGFVPSITKRGFHLPSGVEKTIKKLNDPQYALVVGALTFLLPCGFTQSMQLFAMQSGSALQGALMLGAYGLGTVPLLLGLGLSAGYFKSKMNIFNKIVAGLLVAFGLITFANGWNASQNQTFSSLDQKTETHQSAPDAIVERLAWPHLGNRLEPRNILVEKNKDYQITIYPSMNGLGCKSWINLPDGTRHHIQKDKKISFDFHATEAGSYKLSCSSGSPHGSIVVE